METPPTIAVVAYVRMSSDKQEASPKQQREEITKLAKREGYLILRWYTDVAISGDATEKRLPFQQMIQDAESGEFRAVLA
jgi:site-specific DNA recombinase